MAKVQAKSPFADAEDNNNTDMSEETAVATATEDTSLATPVPSIALDIEPTDLRLPTLKIVAKVGPLSEQFNPGEVVVDGDVVISDGKTPVEFTVLSARKKFIEYTEYGSGQMPRIVYSLEEVTEKGGTTQWSDDPEAPSGRARPSWDAALDMTILVKNSNDEPNAHFPFEFEDTQYAVLSYQVTRSAYSRAAPKILTAYQYHFKQNWLHGTYLLTTHTGTIGGNKVILPEVRYGPTHSDEFKAWATNLVPTS